MSRPFAIAYAGVLLVLTFLFVGKLPYGRGQYTKPIVMWGSFVGATMVLGGLVVGLMRSIRGRRTGT